MAEYDTITYSGRRTFISAVQLETDRIAAVAASDSVFRRILFPSDVGGKSPVYIYLFCVADSVCRYGIDKCGGKICCCVQQSRQNTGKEEGGDHGGDNSCGDTACRNSDKGCKEYLAVRKG